MDKYYLKWKKALDDLNASVEKNEKEIRKCKAQMRRMKDENVDRFCSGHMIRDNNRIIISAPEIIIGDVNKDGMLNGSGASTVIIRANTIKQEGVTSENGAPGRIVQRASIIKNVCEDPGLDGQENTVGDISSFSVQAAGIGMLAECTKGVFVANPIAAATGHVSIQADNSVCVSATMPCKTRKSRIEEMIKEKNKALSDLKKNAAAQKKSVDSALELMDKYLSTGKDLNKDNDTTCTNFIDLDSLHEAVEYTAGSLDVAINECTRVLSRLAEMNRQLTSLEKAKEAIEKYEENYDKENTGARVTIKAENTSIVSMDADGNLRDTESAGLYVQGRNVNFKAQDKEGATMEKSSFNISSHDISLSTANPKKDEKTTDLPATGNVRVTSKNITLESVDYEVKDNEKPEEVSEKALTEGGALNIRVENVGITSYATDGKAGGKFDLNSKDITLRAVDMKVDDKGTASDDKLAEGSKVALVASDIAAGGIDKDKQAKSVKIAFAEEISADAKTKLELKQDEGKKAAVQLADNKVDIKGEEAKVSGKTTIDGETTVTKATSIKAKTEIGGNVSVSGTIDTRNSKSL